MNLELAKKIVEGLEGFGFQADVEETVLGASIVTEAPPSDFGYVCDACDISYDDFESIDWCNRGRYHRAYF